eukprot:c52415_g1_i1.p1 GENE.c52415_g1_i1~~c52415_g1_i1.p1  ORF type:complete len:232 (-),score=40.87 c52415_g1_i1:36-731(-)
MMPSNSPGLRWEDIHIDDFQAMPAKYLPKRVPLSTLERITELGEMAEARGATGEQMRHGSATHWKYYLQAGGWMHKVAPDLIAELRAIMEEADRETWGFLAPEEQVNVRLVEYHTYIEGGDLTKGFELHYDGGSLLTMVVMLSEPDVDFEGGVLVVSAQDWDTFGKQEFVKAGLAARGDCVVFPSHKYHNVSEVTSGVRHVLVMELWNEPEDFKDGRPGYPLILRPNDTAE